MTASAELDAAGRALRLLRGGERALRPLKTGVGWGVYPRGDRRRRPLMTLDQGVVTVMRHRGDVVPLEGGEEGWFVVDVRDKEPPVRRCIPPAPPVAVLANHRAQSRATGFARLAQLAMKQEGPLDDRMLLAANDYIGLWEQARQSGRLTQSWDPTASSRGSRLDVSDVALRTEKARIQLARIKTSLGDAQSLLIDLALIQGDALCKIERRFDLRSGAGGAAVAEALKKLADAFEAGKRAA